MKINKAAAVLVPLLFAGFSLSAQTVEFTSELSSDVASIKKAVPTVRTAQKQILPELKKMRSFCLHRNGLTPELMSRLYWMTGTIGISAWRGMILTGLLNSAQLKSCRLDFMRTFIQTVRIFRFMMTI